MSKSIFAAAPGGRFLWLPLKNVPHKMAAEWQGADRLRFPGASARLMPSIGGGQYQRTHSRRERHYPLHLTHLPSLKPPSTRNPSQNAAHKKSPSGGADGQNKGIKGSFRVNTGGAAIICR
ncbi:TPA: hypothetical protein ACPYU1_003975 [Raoultella planticola]